MKQDSLIVFALVMILSSCGRPGMPADVPAAAITEVPTRSLRTTVTPGCISSQPTQKDIERALSFGKEVIEPDTWQQSSSTAEGYVAVTWQNIPLGAVIYLEVRIKPCGYTDADLDTDFSDENWGLILRNYDTHNLIDACSTGQGLRLYQFKAQNQGLAYNIKYWVRSDSAHRVLTSMFVFPRGSESVLEGYAARLFPDLMACSRE